jgi:PAS domain S-box-containing protein
VVGKQTYQTTFINAYAQEMLGYPIKNWLTIPNFSMSIIHPEDKQRILEESQLAIGRKETGLVRFRFKAKNGEYIWVESRFTPITNEKDEIVGLRGVVTDISERMELEERKDEFIASASHELKTPLTSLKVFTQVLRSLADEHTQPKSVKYLNRMEKEVDRLTELVYDLLDLSKIQRGQLSLNKKRMSLPALLEEIVQNLQPTISQKIELKKLSRISIYTDEQRLNQVFTNLISNAAKYSPDTSTIHIEMTLKDKKIQVSVRDEGIGIAPEYQERIFQRFYRVFDEKDKTYPGLGMGLFISKTIVEQHGGSIWLTSEPQKGSTFFVSLPIRARKEKS